MKILNVKGTDDVEAIKKVQNRLICVETIYQFSSSELRTLV